MLMQYLLAMPGPRAARDRLVLRMPVISPFITSIDTERFSSTLSILVSSGVPLLDGLRIAGAVMTNVHMQQACRKVAVAVQEGESLHQAMTDARLFPPMLVQMVASGEAGGNLETMLARSAKNQGRELEVTLNAVLGILEPLIIVVMATVVGAIVMSVLLPIMQMNTLVT
jgi:general secretion pathway protein F